MQLNWNLLSYRLYTVLKWQMFIFPLRIVSNYVLWRFIRHRINNLDRRFELAQDPLYRMLYGREETPKRNKFCVSYVNGNLGNVVGSMFVKKHFDQQSKRDVSLENALLIVTFLELLHPYSILKSVSSIIFKQRT